MTFVEWSDDFKIGEDEIDREHWGLFAIINDLSDKKIQGAGPESVSATIDALVAYVDVHFEHEERLMQRSRYPGLEGHIELHRRLAGRIAEYKFAYDRDPERFDYEAFMAFLAEWLTDHILHDDLKFATFHRALPAGEIDPAVQEAVSARGSGGGTLLEKLACS